MAEWSGGPWFESLDLFARSTYSTVKAGSHEEACSRRTLLQLAPGATLVCTNDFQRKNMLRNNTFAPEFCFLISNWFDRREQAPGANLLHESVSGASSLVCTEICLPCKTREQKFCYAAYFFR